jgi:ABC-type sugar transport system ATPase subunit
VKHFDAVVAIAGATLEALPGEVMALMGDNGAGKSTLIRCIAGVTRADSGEFLLDGMRLDTSSATRVLDQGIETVYQDLSLVDPMSAVRNVFLGREELRTGLVGGLLRLADDRRMRRRASEALGQLGAHVPDLDAPVGSMSGGQRQAIAIARGLLWGHKVVILDEPTAALGVDQARHVLEMVNNLKGQGVTVILISHNLEHVWQVADRITVLRHGRTVGVRVLAASNPDEIVGLITGSSVLSDASVEPPTNDL